MVEPEDWVIGGPGGVSHMPLIASNRNMNETVNILQVVVTRTTVWERISREYGVVGFAGNELICVDSNAEYCLLGGTAQITLSVIL